LTEENHEYFIITWPPEQESNAGTPVYEAAIAARQSRISINKTDVMKCVVLTSTGMTWLMAGLSIQLLRIVMTYLNLLTGGLTQNYVMRIDGFK
jgi:hypothetical protein